MKDVCLATIAQLEAQGAVVERIDLPLVTAGIPVYYILSPAEVSTNMARFDGIRFGLQGETTDKESIFDYYAAIREQ